MLVVSPLIALMKDQLAHLPKGLPGAMLWSGQQAAQAMQTLRDVRVSLEGTRYYSSVPLPSRAMTIEG